MMELVLTIATFVLIAAAVMVWPASPPRELPQPPNQHLIAGLRDFVSRRS